MQTDLQGRAVCLDDFEGAWHLSRRILDACGGLRGRFEGRAEFTAQGRALCYHEEGRLTLPGHAPFQASRRYIWQDGGDVIEVSHGDGAPFHSFDVTLPRPEARHLCGLDTYIVRYDFTKLPRWQVRWWVRGPNKDYAMVSCYKRFAGAEIPTTVYKKGTWKWPKS